MSPPPPFVAPGALSKDSLNASSSYNKVSLCNFAFLYHIHSAQLNQHLSDIIQHYFPLLFCLPHIYCLFIDYNPFHRRYTVLYPQSTLFPLPLSGTELFPKTVRLQELLPKQEKRQPLAPLGTAVALFLCVCFMSSFLRFFLGFFLGFFSGSFFVFAFFVFCFLRCLITPSVRFGFPQNPEYRTRNSRLLWCAAR